MNLVLQILPFLMFNHGLLWCYLCGKRLDNVSFEGEALATDLLARDPDIAKPMLGELLAANAKYMKSEFLSEQVASSAIELPPS